MLGPVWDSFGHLNQDSMTPHSMKSKKHKKHDYSEIATLQSGNI